MFRAPAEESDPHRQPSRHPRRTSGAHEHTEKPSASPLSYALRHTSKARGSAMAVLRAATLGAACSWEALPSGGDASRAIARNPPPRRRQPHRAAMPATSCRPRPPSASRSAGRSSGTPAPLRSVTSTRTVPSPALTVTVSPGTPGVLCRRLTRAHPDGSDDRSQGCAGRQQHAA